MLGWRRGRRVTHNLSAAAAVKRRYLKRQPGTRNIKRPRSSNTMSTNLSELPATAAKWHKQIADADMKGLSIFDAEACESGSNITHNQFLLLRVLWLKEDQNCFSRTVKNWIPDNEYEEAKRLLKATRYWNRYLESFKQTAAELGGKTTSGPWNIFPRARQSV